MSTVSSPGRPFAMGTGLALVSTVLFGVTAVLGGDGKSAPTPTTTEEPAEDYKNWIELGIGGAIVNGDRAQFEQAHRMQGDEVFGGITDLHYERTLWKETELEVNGHAIFDT